MHILVVEDDRDIADLVAHYLRKAGWEATIASAGAEALAYARAHEVDLVILDVMLPGLSGFEVCRALSSDTATAAVPNVAPVADG